MIQFYGTFTGHLSGQNVSRAFARAIKRANLDMTLWELGSFDPQYDGVEDMPIALRASAPIGIAIGYPWNAKGVLESHPYKRILVTVCETSPIPPAWVTTINDTCTDVVVPSQFCADTFRHCGVKIPIHVIRHGVSEDFFPDGNPPVVGKYIHLLHVSGAVSYPARKGTNALLIAFSRAVHDFPNTRLYLKVKRSEQFEKIIDDLKLTKYVSFLPDLNYPPSVMAHVLRGFDAVVQPSRAEGFGLVPLEARTLGVPAILTDATGHAEHFQAVCDTLVTTGYNEPITVVGNDGGMAPALSIKAVEQGLRTFLGNVMLAKMNTVKWACEFGGLWQWAQVLKPFVKLVQNMAREAPQHHQLGDWGF